MMQAIMHSTDKDPHPGQVRGIDYSAASWHQRRAVVVWGGGGGSWFDACLRARAEHRIACWLAVVYG